MAVNPAEESLKEKFAKELLNYMSINSERLKYINYFIKKNTVYDIKYGAAKSHKEKKQLLLKMYKKTANKFIRGENRKQNSTIKVEVRCLWF